MQRFETDIYIYIEVNLKVNAGLSVKHGGEQNSFAEDGLEAILEI
jgi:hypothetical protein